ncbi:MAG: hypothetical protein ACK5LC_13485 [Coprobacillaceae bacterium]
MKKKIRTAIIRKIFISRLTVFLLLVTCTGQYVSAEETLIDEPEQEESEIVPMDSTNDISVDETTSNLSTATPMGSLLTPVVAWKANGDELSMMASMLYKDAFVEVTSEGFFVTFYFVPTTIMGIPIAPEKVGGVTYQDAEGNFVDAIYEVYDELTKVRSIKIEVSDFVTPVPIHISQSDYGQDIRLKFDLEASSATTTQPEFEAVEVNVDPFDKQWITSFGSEALEYVYDTVTLSNDSYVTVGYSKGTTGDFDSLNKGGTDGYFTIHNSDGTLKNITTLGSTGGDDIYGIIASEDGGFIVAGYYATPNGDFSDLEDDYQGSGDIYIAKFNAAGEEQWKKSYGGSNSDSVTTIKQLADGGYAIVGKTTSSDGDFTDAGFHGSMFADIFVMRLNSDFEVQWTSCMGGSMLETSTKGLVELSDGTIMITGHTSSKNGSYDGIEHIGTYNMFIAKFNGNSGNIELIKKYPVVASRNSYANDLLLLSDGNLLISGSVTTPCWCLFRFRNWR